MIAARQRRLFALVLAANLAAVACFAASSRANDEVSFSADQIMAHARHLAGESFQGRAAGTPFERRAADYVAKQLDAIGVGPLGNGIRMHRFRLSPNGLSPNGLSPNELSPNRNAPESRNVLGLIAPPSANDKEGIIVLGAHIDHLGRTENGGYYPGADDNASGVAVVLEVARTLQRQRDQLRRRVVVVFFGAEEIGMVGSQAFVKQGPVEQSDIVAMVNVDMIGRPLVDQSQLELLKKILRVDSINGIGIVGTKGRPFFAETIREACKQARLTPYGTQAVLSPIVEKLARNRGDHAPFENVGIPTLFIGSGESDDYHKPSDTIDKLQKELMARRALAIYHCVLTLAQTPREKLPEREEREKKS